MSTGGLEHDRLIQEIIVEMKETAAYTGRSALCAATLEALRRVDRRAFVNDSDKRTAYINRPLGIGHQQTISQPYIVALMTDVLDLDKKSRVLEIGTGSGYQSAVLGELAEKVYSIEIVPELARSAAQRLHSHGYSNIVVKHGNGRLGWNEHAPFDAIIVTAAAESVPDALIRQLATDGHLIIPLERDAYSQILVLLTRTRNGEIHQREILPVVFVPLTGSE